MPRAPFAKTLLGAIFEDAVSSKVPCVSTMKAIARQYFPSSLTKNYFLKWDDIGFTVSFYHSEISRMLRFHANGRGYVVPQVVTIDNHDNSITLNEIRFRTSSELFSLDDSLRGSSEKIFRKYRRYLRWRFRKYFNGQLLRLNGVKQIGDQLALVSQPVLYESVCKTNLSLDAKKMPSISSIREIVHAEGKLDPLESSRLANPLGVNFLLFTADGKVVLPKRSRRVIVRPALLSPSFSGDIEYTDSGTGALRKSVIIREGFEEINLLEKHLPKEIAFLGLTRELVRGGKPEMFFAAQSSLTAQDLCKLHRSARDQYEFSRPGSWVFWAFGENAMNMEHSDNAKYALRHAFEQLINKYGDVISMPLLTNLVLWMRQRVGSTFSQA